MYLDTPMGTDELSLEQLTDFAREQLGLDIDLDRTAMAKLAAIGLTMHTWRNTSLENLHAGDHPGGGFPDAHMMRYNIVTFRVVSEHVGADSFDWDALRIALTSRDRMLPGGLTVGMLAGDEFKRLASDARTAIRVSQQIEQQRGFAYLLTLLALQAGISYKEWYGSPWWRDIVDVFVELLADPTSSAWKYDEHHAVEPAAVSDRASLARVLVETPESLDDDSIYWCLAHGLSRQATFGGFARWRTRRDHDWVDPMSWLSES